MNNCFNITKLLTVTSSSFLLSLLLLFFISSASAVTLLTTIGNPVTQTTNIFRSNVNPTWDFQTAAGSGQTVNSIVFQMNATSSAGSGYPEADICLTADL